MGYKKQVKNNFFAVILLSGNFSIYRWLLPPIIISVLFASQMVMFYFYFSFYTYSLEFYYRKELSFASIYLIF